MTTRSAIAITLDVDWAPDFVIDAVAERLLSRQVRATWFITHHSPAIDRLRLHPDLFELGIHPNFLAGSTQGGDPASVLAFCLRIVPAATSMRMHALMQSTPLLETAMRHTEIGVDVSLFLPHATHVDAVTYWWEQRSLLRIPYVWEDDFEIERPSPIWRLGQLAQKPGLRVFDFHPIHVYLNSSNLLAYQQLKQRVPVITRATLEQTADLVQRNDGAGSALDSLMEVIGTGGGHRIADLAALTAGGRR